MGIANTLSFLLSHPLSQGRRLKTLSRFLRWQVGARLVPGPVACEIANGACLLVRPGMTGATGNLYVGLHEFEDMAFVLHFLRQGDLFVDVGANIGSYTVLAAAGAKAQCVAFEPGAAAFGWLERNLRLNGVSARVELHPSAVGARVGTVELSRGGDTVNHVVMEPAAEEGATDRVPLTTLDGVLAGRVPILLKIDVEGFETEVLKGAVQTLAAPGLRALLMELNGSGRRYGYADGDLRHRLEALGFEECAYQPFERRLLPRGEGRAGAANSLFVRDRAWVEGRLSQAPLIEVQGWRI